MDTETKEKTDTEKVKCPKCGYDDIHLVQKKDGKRIVFLFCIGYVFLYVLFPIPLEDNLFGRLVGISFIIYSLVLFAESGKNTLVCKRCFMEWHPNEENKKEHINDENIIVKIFNSLKE